MVLNFSLAEYTLFPRVLLNQSSSAGVSNKPRVLHRPEPCRHTLFLFTAAGCERSCSRSKVHKYIYTRELPDSGCPPSATGAAGEAVKCVLGSSSPQQKKRVVCHSPSELQRHKAENLE